MASASDIVEPSAEDKLRSRVERAAIDAAARAPVLHFFFSALFWLLAGSALAIIASIKLHSPTFLAQQDWLTFGRVRPAHLNTMVYGWASMGGNGVSVWIMSRLCRAPLRQTGWLHVSAVLLNVGNLVGTYGVLAGRSTSFEWLEYPREAGVFAFSATLIAIAARPL